MPQSPGRMTLGEMLTNIVWAKCTKRQHIRCSLNWMYAAKLPGEGALMYDAAKAMRDAMLEIGVAIDGGKDSLSMAANVDGEVVKCPGQLCLSSYVMCPDVTLTVTPDFKPSAGSIFFVKLSGGDKCRIGGSSLAHCFGQIGSVEDVPDVDDFGLVARAFDAVQGLLSTRSIAAGHDVSTAASSRQYWRWLLPAIWE